MDMGFAPTWLRQVSPPASHDHFNHCTQLFMLREISRLHRSVCGRWS